MKKRFVINPLHCAFGVFIAVISAILVWVMLFSLRRPGSMVMFAVFMLIGIAIALFYGRTIRVEQEGLHRELLGYPLQFLPWDGIQEVGVAGTKVFHGKNSRNTGTPYLYFAKEPQDDSTRFRMVLEWPPKTAWFLRFNDERLAAVQMEWKKEIFMYNIGNQHFADKSKN